MFNTNTGPVPDIEFRSLYLSFDTKKVLEDLSLKVYPGRKVLISGRSGTGKSSIFNCLLGFLRPDSGEILVQGQSLSALSVWEIRRKMAFVAQEPELGSGKVREVLERPFTYKHNRPVRENLDKLRMLWGAFLLEDALLEKDMSLLSGGEKQRTAIVLALLLERPILLLDEASSALDRESKSAVSCHLQGRDDLTILAISHDQEWANCCDSRFTLSEGKAVFFTQ